MNDPIVFEDVEKVAVVEVDPVSETVEIVEIVEDVKVVDLDAVPRCDETVDSTVVDEVWTFDDAEADVADFDIDVALVCDETVEVLVEDDSELGDVLDVVSVEGGDVGLLVIVTDGTIDDDSVLEDIEGVGRDGIRVIPSSDKTLKAIFSPRDGVLACGIAASKCENSEELNAHRRPSLSPGAVDAASLEEFVETNGVAVCRDPLVVLGDGFKPGMLTGKHFDGRRPQWCRPREVMRSNACVDPQIHLDTNFAIDRDCCLRSAGIIITGAVLICIRIISPL